MIKTDLLHGEGRPYQSRPDIVAAVTFMFLVPLLLIGLILFKHKTVSIEHDIQVKAIDNIERKLSVLSSEASFYNKAKKEISNTKKCIEGLNDVLPRMTQWSDIMTEVTANVPHSCVLDKVSVSVIRKTISVPDFNKPERDVKLSVPTRSLKLLAYDKIGTDSDLLIAGYISSLNNIGNENKKFFSSVTLVGSSLAVIDDKDTALYEIDCELATSY